MLSAELDASILNPACVRRRAKACAERETGRQNLGDVPVEVQWEKRKQTDQQNRKKKDDGAMTD